MPNAPDDNFILLDSLPLPAALVSRNLKFVKANELALLLLGKDNIEGEDFFALLSPCESFLQRQSSDFWPETGKTSRFETRIANANSIVTAQIKGLPDSTYLALFVPEADPRELAAGQQVEIERRFRKLLGASDSYLTEICADGTILYINDRFLNFLGQKTQNLVGKSIFSLVSEADRAHFEEEFAARRETGFSQGIIESRIATADGVLKDLVWRVFVLKDQNDRVSSFITMARDVTAEKIAEFQRVRMIEELNCHFTITNILADRNNTLEATFAKVAAAIPGAFASSGACQARLAIGDAGYDAGAKGKLVNSISENIFVSGVAVGSLTVGHVDQGTGKKSFTADEHSFLADAAKRLGFFLQRKKIQEESKRQNRINAELASVGRTLIERVRIDETCEIIRDKALALSGSASACVCYLDEKGEHFMQSVSVDEQLSFFDIHDELKKFEEANCPGAPNKPVMVNSTGFGRIGRYIKVPALIGDETVGQILLVNATKPYDAKDLEMAERFADILAAGVARWRIEKNLDLHKANLERLVSERTQELRVTNEKLQTEIAEKQTREALLRERTAEIEAVFANIPDLVVYADNRRNIIAVNDVLLKTFGYGKDELIGQSVKLLYASEDDYSYMGQVKFNPSSSKSSTLVEIEYRKKDGSTFFCEVAGTTVLNSDGEIYGYLAIMRDMTERLANQADLAEKDERIHLLLDYTAEGIYSCDTKGVCTFVNPACLKLLGYDDAEELLGRKIHDIIHHKRETGEYFPASECKIYKTFFDGEPRFSEDEVFWRKDGTSFPVSYQARALYKDGAMVGGVVSFIDISKRKAAEHSRDTLGEAVMQAAETIVITDVNGVIQYANPAFEKNTGYTAAELVGKTPAIFKSGKHDASFYKKLWATILNGEVWVGNFINLKKDGTEYEEEATISPLRDKSGRIRNFVAVKRDVTREKKIEAKLVEAQRLEAIGTLAGGIAHDFNNILTAILGFSEITLEMKPDEKYYQDNIKQVIKAGLRAKDLVEQILTFSRQSEKELKPLLLGPLVKEVSKLLRSAMPSTIDVDADLDTKWPVLADASEIHQIVMGLGTNAKQAMEDTGGTFTIEGSDLEVGEEGVPQIPDLPKGRYVHLSFTDTGHGMDEYTKQHVFEPYFTTKKKTEGSGLGLALVHGIVTSYGGGISVTSTLGSGATFDLYLPAMSGKPADEEAFEEELPKGRGERILFVDDEHFQARLAKRMLEDVLNYKATVELDSEVALELVRSDPQAFDLVITDLTMPKLTGDLMAKEMLKIRPDLPILMCTGFSEHINKDLAEAMGMKGLLPKPLILKSFAHSIRKILDDAKES